MNEKITDKKWFIYGLVPICALLWGLSFLGSTIALRSLDVIQLLSLRWTVATLVFLLLTAFGAVKISYKGKTKKWIMLVGFLEPCIYSIFETLGVKYTTTSESSIFIATIPLMVLLIGELIFRRKNSRKVRGGIIIAFVGVMVCILFSPAFSLDARGKGYIFLMGAVFCGSLYSYASSHASEEYNSVEITFNMAVMGCIFFNCINFAMGNGFSGYRMCFQDMNLLIAVLFLGVGCSCICYLIFNFVLGKMPATTATNLVSNSTTAVGVLSGCIFAGDPFGWYTVVGLVLTIGGIYLSSAKDGE